MAVLGERLQLSFRILPAGYLKVLSELSAGELISYPDSRALRPLPYSLATTTQRRHGSGPAAGHQ